MNNMALIAKMSKELVNSKEQTNRKNKNKVLKIFNSEQFVKSAKEYIKENINIQDEYLVEGLIRIFFKEYLNSETERLELEGRLFTFVETVKRIYYLYLSRQELDELIELGRKDENMRTNGAYILEAYAKFVN